MTSKYEKILTDIISRFSVDLNVDEKTRRILRDVINAELSKLSMRNPHSIIKEIKEIIEREAKTILKK